jgi:hypothetical protein
VLTESGHQNHQKMTNTNANALFKLQIAARTEATCYSLPYGAIGFASHILAYYQMTILLLGRQPLLPWRRLKYTLIGTILAIIQQITTIVLSSITISRCQHQWHFMLLGISMLTTSIVSSVLNIVAYHIYIDDPKLNPRMPKKIFTGSSGTLPSLLARNLDSEGRPQKSRRRSLRRDMNPVAELILSVLAILWFCGCVAGCVGILSIGAPQFRLSGTLQIITGVFGALAFLPIWAIVWSSLCGCCCCLIPAKGKGVTSSMLLVVLPITISASAILWMDWNLGVVTGNLIGLPETKNEVIYWMYFAVERIGLFSL